MRFLALSTALLLGATSLAAQDDCLQLMKLPTPGAWAEYKAHFQQKEPYTIRYAVIGNEARGGKELQWVEMRMEGGKQNQVMIYQTLVPGSLAAMDQVQEVIFKQGDKPAMKMNGAMLSMMRGQLEKQSPYQQACQGVTLVGKESVKVPAGTFEASHFRSAEHSVDSWVSPVVPFSMVKTTGKDFQMELTAQGEGAKSSITEEPQEMPGMGGPSSH
jgi:hypothetical protein